jgi:hypothetical protein
MTSSKRHFTVIMNSKEHGLYVSSTPSSAARKAVSKLCADNKNKKVEFRLRETTQGSNKKVYGPYIGYMQKLDKPVELKGRVIRYKPIAKRIEKQNNQVGGNLEIGDKVRTKGKLRDKNLEGKQNIFYVIATFPEKSKFSQLITIRHIDNSPKTYQIYKDKVEKINNNSEASSASAASAAKVNNASTWEELSGHVNNNNNNNNGEWSFVKNNDGKANMGKPVLVKANNWVNVGNPKK